MRNRQSDRSQPEHSIHFYITIIKAIILFYCAASSLGNHGTVDSCASSVNRSTHTPKRGNRATKRADDHAELTESVCQLETSKQTVGRYILCPYTGCLHTTPLETRSWFTRRLLEWQSFCMGCFVGLGNR